MALYCVDVRLLIFVCPSVNGFDSGVHPQAEHPVFQQLKNSLHGSTRVYLQQCNNVLKTLDMLSRLMMRTKYICDWGSAPNPAGEA